MTRGPLPVLRLGAVAVAAVLVAAACAAPRDAAEGRVVRITLREFGYAPSLVTLRVGELVTLDLVNRGELFHELMAGSGEILPHGGYTEDLFAGVETRMRGNDPAVHSHGGFGILVANGTTATLTFTVPDRPGTYEMACFEGGHYLAGMVGRIVIER